ncbi:phospholipase D-like domain-containing protein, partial [Arthrospira platensis SPKY1]|nr:phospholipase D-like domain-containing protein [Arthrospira platensis SPKY1]
CVLDETTVITGSYNWTHRARQAEENILVARGDAALAQGYQDAFERLLVKYLIRTDTEGFFRRHPVFFRLVASRHYPLDEALLDHYADLWEWERLSVSETLPWSEALLDRYADRWEWGRLSEKAGLPWSEALLDRYAD